MYLTVSFVSAFDYNFVLTFALTFLSSGMDVDMESQGSSQYPSPDQYIVSEEADQGWVSWAWSFVPAIVGTEDENEEGVYQLRDTGGIPSNYPQHTSKDPIVSIGFYCTKASVTFKVNQTLNQLFTCITIFSCPIVSIVLQSCSIHVLTRGKIKMYMS